MINALGVNSRLVGAAAFVAVAAAAVLLLLPAREQAQAGTFTLPPAKAAALVQATTGGSALEMRAIGEQAKLINASLPFASGGVQAARPFSASGSDLDQRRALLCLTQAVYYEAGFEPLNGRRAVAQVVLNRMRHPAFPKSVCGVVYQGAGTRVCQFTFVCDGALYRAPSRQGWLQAEAVARAALSGYVDGSVGQATHYHADYVAPRWAPMLAKITQIGQHIFYRWPGAWGQAGAFTGRYIGEPRDPLSMRPSMPINAVLTSDANAPVGGAVNDGTVLKRAPNDVGGLLDASKGWTLNIPRPEEAGSAAARLIASQERKPAPVTEVVAAYSGSAVAGR